jgi:hypothetical protein
VHAQGHNQDLSGQGGKREKKKDRFDNQITCKHFLEKIYPKQAKKNRPMIETTGLKVFFIVFF